MGSIIHGIGLFFQTGMLIMTEVFGMSLIVPLFWIGSFVGEFFLFSLFAGLLDHSDKEC